MPVGWHLTDTRCAIGEVVSVRQLPLGEPTTGALS